MHNPEISNSELFMDENLGPFHGILYCIVILSGSCLRSLTFSLVSTSWYDYVFLPLLEIRARVNLCISIDKKLPIRWFKIANFILLYLKKKRVSKISKFFNTFENLYLIAKIVSRVYDFSLERVSNFIFIQPSIVVK